jgi:ketosteroid isomerase-like protein
MAPGPARTLPRRACLDQMSAPDMSLLVFGPIIRDVPNFAVSPEELIGSGDTVAVVVRYTGTGQATGKQLDVPVVHVWAVRDGKIARFGQFIDTGMFLEVVPAPEAIATA